MDSSGANAQRSFVDRIAPSRPGERARTFSAVAKKPVTKRSFTNCSSESVRAEAVDYGQGFIV
jgi:hypothetical protein